MMRHLIWFSNGAASAVMAKMVLKEIPQALVMQCDMGDSEDADNRRFGQDCEKWFGTKIAYIRSVKYRNIDEVFEKRRYLAGQNGAPCTSEMKAIPRLDFQLPSDTHYWGYTADAEDVKRWDRMQETYPEMKQRAPLIEQGITKAACFTLLHRQGALLLGMLDDASVGADYNAGKCRSARRYSFGT